MAVKEVTPHLHPHHLRKYPPDRSGFTLIELMIVVAIIAIILTLALPIYSEFSIRAKLGEALSVAAGAKTAVATTCIKDPTILAITASNVGYAFPAPTQYVANISVRGPCTQPVITIQTKDTGAVPSPLITLTGELGRGRIQYTCTTDGFSSHVPQECRN